MTKTANSLIELCRALPSSEAELHSRADEMINEVTSKLCIMDLCDAATALIALPTIHSIKIFIRKRIGGQIEYECVIEGEILNDGRWQDVTWSTIASTEELARAACALLAVDATGLGQHNQA